MLFLKLALQILAVVSALLTSTLDYVAHDKRTRVFKYFRVGLYGVVGISLITGIIVTVGDDMAKKEEPIFLCCSRFRAFCSAEALTNILRARPDGRGSDFFTGFQSRE